VIFPSGKAAGYRTNPDFADSLKISMGDASMADVAKGGKVV